jgi:hypothetical protein
MSLTNWQTSNWKITSTNPKKIHSPKEFRDTHNLAGVIIEGLHLYETGLLKVRKMIRVIEGMNLIKVHYIHV